MSRRDRKFLRFLQELVAILTESRVNRENDLDRFLERVELLIERTRRRRQAGFQANRTRRIASASVNGKTTVDGVLDSLLPFEEGEE